VRTGPADPARRRIERRDPTIVRRERVRHARPVRIVEVHREPILGHRVQEHVEEIVDLDGHRLSDRVPDRDLVHVEIDEAPHHFRDRARLDLASYGHQNAVET
jgi:hypothetical protein